MILALRSTASSFACVEAIRSFPLQSSLIRSMTVCFVAGSSPVNGSSMRIISAGERSARRTERRRFIPPENSQTGFSSASAGRRRRSEVVSVSFEYRFPSAKNRFSTAENPSKRRSSWKTAEICGRRSEPLNRTSPRSGDSSPRIRRKSVVFPLPDGAIRQ